MADDDKERAKQAAKDALAERVRRGNLDTTVARSAIVEAIRELRGNK